MKLETEVWLAGLEPSLGGNLVRLLHKPSGLEVLRSPESPDALRARPEVYGIPVLIPPNRIDHGSFTWNDRRCSLPLNEPARDNHIHGVALGRPWTLDSQSENSAIVSFTHEKGCETFKGFPFKFKLSLEYRFETARVLQTATVENLGKEAMPLGLGFHTSFRLPASDARLWLSAGETRWEIEDGRKLPTGRLVSWDSGQTMHMPGGQPLDGYALSVQCPMRNAELAGCPFRGAVIESQALKTRIVYEVGPEYGQWCVWNDGGGKGFVCVEPMTCMTNAFNMALPSSESGLQSLESGGAFRASTAISTSPATSPFHG